jgi:hypothetical protein
VRRLRKLGSWSVVAVVAALVAAGPALAQGGVQNPATNPFSPGLPQQQATVPTQTAPLSTAATSSSSSGISGSTALAIAIGALLMLAGISYFIWRDARRRAPLRAAATGPAPPRVPGSKRVKPRKLSPAERRRRKRGRAR